MLACNFRLNVFRAIRARWRIQSESCLLHREPGSWSSMYHRIPSIKSQPPPPKYLGDVDAGLVYGQLAEKLALIITGYTHSRIQSTAELKSITYHVDGRIKTLFFDPLLWWLSHNLSQPYFAKHILPILTCALVYPDRLASHIVDFGTYSPAPRCCTKNKEHRLASHHYLPSSGFQTISLLVTNKEHSKYHVSGFWCACLFTVYPRNLSVWLVPIASSRQSSTQDNGYCMSRDNYHT